MEMSESRASPQIQVKKRKKKINEYLIGLTRKTKNLFMYY